MDAQRRKWLGGLFALGLAGVLGLATLLALATREVYAEPGTELRCEDVGFRALGVALAERVGTGAAQLVPRGVFLVVRLEVADHAVDGEYDLAWHHALLMDASGGVHALDRAATHALRDAEAAAPPARLAPGERAVTPLVYDVPRDAHGFTLRIAWESAALLNLVDLVVHGDRRLVLDGPH